MDINDLKKEMGRSDVKNSIVGGFILAFGLFIIWMVVADVDQSSDVGTGGMVVIWVLAGLCVLMGGFSIFNVIKGKMQRSKGTHPLLNAITSKETDFIVWIYENISSVKGGGSSHQIYMTTKYDKLIIITVKGKRVKDLLLYLHSEFPSSELGYSDEIKDRVTEKMKELKNRQSHKY